MEIKISVIIPTYKRPKLLTRCLQALVEQTLSLTDFEVIVVSDGPDKGTLIELLPWMKKKELNLVYLNNKRKAGPAAARNLGWRSARAETVAFTDDDCIPSKNWLEAFLGHFDAVHDMAIALSGHTYVPLPEKPTDFELNTGQLQRAEFITANCACSKTALFETGGFDERFKLAWREDSDLQFKLILNQIPIRKVSNAIVVHPVRNAPWGVSLKEQKKGIYDALLYKNYPALYRSKIQKNPIWNYYFINSLWIMVLVSLLYSSELLFTVSITTLLLMIAQFIRKRLQNTSKSFKHVIEMVSTSIIIPTLSVFWRVYGAVKFRVFFI